MKRLGGLRLILGAYFFCLFSCGNEQENENHIQPSVSLVEMSGGGGSAEITFRDENWVVVNVVSSPSYLPIVGNVYDQSGKLISQNGVMKLVEFGSVRSTQLFNREVTIVRDNPRSLRIVLGENEELTPFRFVVILQWRNETCEITVNQNESFGYELEKIEFSIEKGDGDATSIVNVQNLSIESPNGMDFTFYPFCNVKNESYFDSKDPLAFSLLAQDSVRVHVPYDIQDGKVIVGEEKRIYARFRDLRPTGLEKIESVKYVPPGRHFYGYMIEIRRRCLSYTLTAVNRGTGKRRITSGKWIEKTPTGYFLIIKRVDGAPAQ